MTATKVTAPNPRKTFVSSSLAPGPMNHLALPTMDTDRYFLRDPDGNVIEIGDWPEVQEMVAFLGNQE